MSIQTFQEACYTYSIATSFCTTQTDNIIPKGNEAQKMIVRLWKDEGKNFSFGIAKQDRSVVFDPIDKSITYPNPEQLEKLDETVRDCISKLLVCLQEAQFPITQEQVKNILGNTIVVLLDKSQQETASPFSQVV